MFCFNAGFSVEREAHLVGMGLSEVNLSMLLHVEKSIVFRSELVGLSDPGCDFVLFAVRDQSHMKQRVNLILDPKDKAKDARLACFNVQDKMYVLPLFEARQKFLIGINSTTSYRLLRQGGALHFRSRMVSGVGIGMQVEVMVFWGLTEETIEEGMYANNLIRPGQKVQRIELKE